MIDSRKFIVGQLYTDSFVFNIQDNKICTADSIDLRIRCIRQERAYCLLCGRLALHNDKVKGQQSHLVSRGSRSTNHRHSSCGHPQQL